MLARTAFQKTLKKRGTRIFLRSPVLSRFFLPSSMRSDQCIRFFTRPLTRGFAGCRCPHATRPAGIGGLGEITFGPGHSGVAPMRSGVILVAALVLGPVTGLAQAPAGLLPAVQRFVEVDAPAVAITHVKLIDGTGAPARDDQTIVIQNGKIT